MQIKMSLQHETFLTERKIAIIFFSTNQPSLWDDCLNLRPIGTAGW